MALPPRILLVQSKASPDWHTAYDQQTSLLAVTAAACARRPGTRSISTGALWEQWPDKNFAAWPQYVFSQRPSERFSALVLDQPWLGKATVDLVTRALQGDPETGAAPVPVYYWDPASILQPAVGAPWELLSKTVSRSPDGFTQVTHIARPTCLCGCWDCTKKERIHPPILGGVEPPALRRAKGEASHPQRPFQAEAGGYCVAFSDTHRELLESYIFAEADAVPSGEVEDLSQ